MIPKIIHQMWVGPLEMPVREKALVKKLIDQHPDFEHRLWTDETIGEFPTTPKMRELLDHWRKKKEYAFIADAMRQYAVYKYGGFYCDVDMEFREPLTKFAETTDGLFFYHPWEHDISIPNTFFGARPGFEPLLKFYYEAESAYEWWGPEPFGISFKKALGLAPDCEDEVLINKLKQENMLCLSWPDSDKTLFTHLSLYSWSPEYVSQLH